MAPTATSRQAIWAFIEHEHRDLVRGINRIHDVGCETGGRPTPELSVHVLDILRWFETTLEPHMAWEEAMLYPAIDGQVGTPWATRTARFDHQQIREVAARLRAGQHELRDHAGTDPKADIRCALFGLEALLRAHVEREERFFIPVLGEDGALPVESTVSPAWVSSHPRTRS